MPRPKKTLETKLGEPPAAEIKACEPIFESKEPATVSYSFNPQIKSYDESVQRELNDEISRIAAFYSINPKELSASISLTYENDAWILKGEVLHITHAKEEGN